jgi:prepilin peptidase CpaA
MTAMMVVVSVYGGLLATAALSDVGYLTIPNLIPIALSGLFFVAAALAPQPVDWISHLSAGAVVLVICMALFAWGKLGGGDAKLLAAVALWHGLYMLPSLLLAIALAGGGVALLWIAFRQFGFGLLFEAHGVRLVSFEAGKGIPYAVAIAAGCWLMLSQLPVL